MKALESVPVVVRAAPTIFRVAFADLVAYRAEMTIWILTATFPIIMLALWSAVAQDGPVGGFGQAELARYFAVTLVVRQLTSAWVVWVINWEIRSGRMSMRLLRPIHPLALEFVWTLTAMPFRMVILLPLLALLLLWRPDLWLLPDPLALLLFVPSVFMAFCIAFLVQCLFATLSFWLDKTDGIFGVWFSTWMLLSGYIAPLSLFPEWAHGALFVLPFRAMLAVPVELLGGFLAPADALPDLGVQLAWTVGLFLLLRWTWARGVRKYGAFGA